MSSNAPLIIPQGEILSYPMGGTHHGFLREIFGEWPDNEPEKDDDSRRERSKKVIAELLMFYYHEEVFDRFIYDGYLDGLTHMDRLLSYYSYENAVQKAHALVHDRLSVIKHIEAVFFAYIGSNRCRKRISQTCEEISPMESYVFALREGLKYGLVLSLSLAAEGRQQPEVASFYGPEVDFVMNEQPKFLVKHLARLNIKTIDARAHGLPYFLDFVNTISLFEVWMREDHTLYNPIADPVNNRFRRILVRRDLQILYVKALRANKQMFHLARLGYGMTSCRPAPGNLVFDFSVPADLVPTCHVADALVGPDNPFDSRLEWQK